LVYLRIILYKKYLLVFIVYNILHYEKRKRYTNKGR